MRVDFYQLGGTAPAAALAQIAQATLVAGGRLLAVSSDDAQLAVISDALWSRTPASFLAHGLAGGPHDARQPILLAGTVEPANGATYLCLADGRWRDEAEGFARVFLLFDAATLDDARGTWRMLGERDAVERRFWKQDDGKWVEGP